MLIAIFGRAIEEQWKPKLFQVLGYLESRGVSLIWFEPFYRFVKEQLQCPLSCVATYTRQSEIPDDCSLLLTLGGDGTFLDSLFFIKDRPIPVAGVHFGRLGFLAGVGSESCFSDLERLITGEYSIEERSVVEVSSPVLPESFFPYALNDCILQRDGPDMISISVRLQAGELPTYWADGLIVATPTGSTAYSLSVGGPIVFPKANILIVAPIAPHNLNTRPIVIPDSEALTVSAQGRAEKLILTLDNRSVSIPCGAEIYIRKSPFVLRYVSLNGQHFISALHQKLLWGVDRRNFGT